MKRLLLTFMFVIGTFTFATNTVESTSTPEILKKEVTSGVATFELFTIKNISNKKDKIFHSVWFILRRWKWKSCRVTTNKENNNN